MFMGKRLYLVEFYCVGPNGEPAHCIEFAWIYVQDKPPQRERVQDVVSKLMGFQETIQITEQSHVVPLSGCARVHVLEDHDNAEPGDRFDGLS